MKASLIFSYGNHKKGGFNMYSSKLPSPLTFNATSIEYAVESIYSYFYNNIQEKNKRPLLKGYFIYLNCSRYVQEKNSVFWHLVSLNQNESFNILPCNNCVSGMICPLNCENETTQITLGKTTRNICLYRGIRINWINRIIELTNQNDNSIKTWKVNHIIKNQVSTRRYIRFTHEAVDYLIILEEKYKKNQEGKNEFNFFNFVSAFPVFYINKKREYDDMYNQHLKGKTITIK